MEAWMAKAEVRIRRGTTRKVHNIGSRCVDLAKVIAPRRAHILDEARAAGLIDGRKDAHISGRVPGSLIDAAKKRARLSSDTDLIEYALVTVALQDDFGLWLVSRKGSVSTDIDLEGTTLHPADHAPVLRGAG